MSDKECWFITRAPLNDVAALFRDAVLNARPPGRRFLASSMAGEVKFSKPDKGPFDDVDAKPDFEVAAVVPLTSGFSPGFVNLYISLFNVDRGVYGYLNVSGPNGRRAAGSYFDTVLSGLRHRDPKMEMTLSPGGLEF